MSFSNAGSIEQKRLTKAKLFFKRAGETGYNDLGNVLSFKEDNEKKTVEHSVAEKGFNRKDDENVSEFGIKYAFQMDEHFAETRKILFQGTKNADVTQASVTSQTFTFTAPAATSDLRTFWIGKYGVIVESVTVSSAAKVEGVDYTYDPASGMITWLEQSTTTSGTVTVTYSAYSATFESYTAASSIMNRGEFRIYEYDAFETAPVEITTFPGVTFASNWGDDDTTKNNEFEFTVRATDIPTVATRG